VQQFDDGWILEQKMELKGIGICRDLLHLPEGTRFEVACDRPLLAISQTPAYVVQTASGEVLEVGDPSCTQVSLFRVAPGVNVTVADQEGLAELFYITIRPDMLKNLCRGYPELRRFRRWEHFTNTSKVENLNLTTNVIREEMKRSILATQDLKPQSKRYIVRCTINYIVNFLNELIESSHEARTEEQVRFAEKIAAEIRENAERYYMEAYLTQTFGKPYEELDEAFRYVMHNSIEEYLKMVRMDWAYKQLTSTMENSEHIASHCGYLPWLRNEERQIEDERSFSSFKVDFKMYFSMSVQEVRAEMN
jgi:AraC-like DNA-binding protein